MKILHKIGQFDKYLLKRRFLLLIIFSPFFWWLIFSPVKVFAKWFSYPRNLINKVGSVFSEENLSGINELRWDSFSERRDDPASRLYYNKGTLIINELFDYASYLSPTYYFQASGEGTFSPSGVELIPGVLFFFWILGLVYCIKNKKFKVIKHALVFAAIAYLAGQKNIALLFPVAFLYLFLSYQGIEKSLKPVLKNFSYRFIQFYGVFLIIRSLWQSLI